jgi:hypothetical protein
MVTPVLHDPTRKRRQFLGRSLRHLDEQVPRQHQQPRDVLLRIGRGRLGFKFTTGFIGYDEPLSQEQNGTRTRATCLYPTTGTVASFGLEDMEIDFA